MKLSNVGSTVFLVCIIVVIMFFSQGCGPQFVSDNGSSRVSETSALYWFIWAIGSAILWYISQKYFAYIWLFLVIITTVLVSASLGSNFIYVLLYIAIAVVLHIVNVYLTKRYITAWMHSEKLPIEMANGTWEATAGLGVVPKWVSFIGLTASGLFFSGVLLAILLLVGVIDLI